MELVQRDIYLRLEMLRYQQKPETVFRERKKTTRGGKGGGKKKGSRLWEKSPPPPKSKPPQNFVFACPRVPQPYLSTPEIWDPSLRMKGDIKTFLKKRIVSRKFPSVRPWKGGGPFSRDSLPALLRGKKKLPIKRQQSTDTTTGGHIPIAARMGGIMKKGGGEGAASSEEKVSSDHFLTFPRERGEHNFVKADGKEGGRAKKVNAKSKASRVGVVVKSCGHLLGKSSRKTRMILEKGFCKK